MAYIEFLRFCLNRDLLVPASAKEINWSYFMLWAESQAIVGIIYQGILKAGDSITMPFDLKMQCQSDRVFFVGRLSDDELRWYHYVASVFAFPSITKNEAFGVALAEAMYCYTPAITFTIPGSGVNWVNLDGVTGIECPNKDSKAFAAAIDKLLSDEKLAQQYAEAAHQRVIENFTIPKMMERMNEVYEELS